MKTAQKRENNIQKQMVEALEAYKKDKSCVKEFSVCMQESRQWLKEREQK